MWRGASQSFLFKHDDMWSAVASGKREAIQSLAAVPGSVVKDQPRGLAERGGEGETILHAAILCKVDYGIIEWIVTSFPALVSCCYLGKRYKGETALHMAVVQYGDDEIETNQSVVRLLLDSLDRQEAIKLFERRVSGNEFKHKENGSLKSYGETPLHFAVVSGKFKTVKLFVERGANVNVVDTRSGYNVLHFLAKNTRLETSKFVELFRFLKDTDPTLMNHRNVSWKEKEEMLVPKTRSASGRFENGKPMSGLTPLELGAHEGNLNILEAIKEPLWEFDQTTRYNVPLNDLDPFLHSLKKQDTYPNLPQAKSVVQIVVESQNKEMINHPIIDSILKYKWKLYARHIYLTRFLGTFFLYAFLLTPAIALEPNTFYARRHYDFQTWQDTIRAILEILTLVGALVVVQTQYTKMRAFGSEYFNGFLAAEHSVQLLFCVSVLVMPGIRFGSSLETATGLWAENVVLGLAAIFGWSHLLHFAKGSEQVGPLAVVSWKVVTNDFVQWLKIYVPVTVGFGGALFLQMQNVPSVVQSEIAAGSTSTAVYDWDTYLGSGIWATRFIFQEENYDDFRKAQWPLYTQGLFLVYTMFSVVLLVNVLIGKVVETFTEVHKDLTREWKVEIASLILSIDLQLSQEKREMHQEEFGFTIVDDEAVPTDLAHDKNETKYFMFTENLQRKSGCAHCAKQASACGDVVQVVVGKTVVAEGNGGHLRDIVCTAKDLEHWTSWWSVLKGVLGIQDRKEPIDEDFDEVDDDVPQTLVKDSRDHENISKELV